MSARPCIALTGGAGYIGSHACVELLASGFEVVVIDNLVNSHSDSLRRVEAITAKQLRFELCDVRDCARVETILKESNAQAVIHFAGLKAVGESAQVPLEYYSANVVGSHALLAAMQRAGVGALIFSSSATVYGEPQWLPVTEQHPLAPTNPYGATKRIVEDMLRDCVDALGIRVAILRYFNPVGAHESGLIGEDPLGAPNNLMPYIAQVAGGRREKLHIWGDDYPTPDGTGVRDYIHVVDLAQAHVRAAEKLLNGAASMTVNLGTGRGYSVLEVVRAFEAASGRQVPYLICTRRPGDVASCFADPSLAAELLGWRAERGLADMCRDHWAWQSANPLGFRD